MVEYEILGVGNRFEYTDKRSGARVGARTLHLVYGSDDVKGYAVKELFVTDDRLGSYQPKVNDHVNLIYDVGYRGQAFLAAINPIANEK